jgi:hypothetical protein
LLLGRIELVVVELDIGVELDATECTEVAGTKLVDNTDLCNGHGGWMERNRNGRRKYGRWQLKALVWFWLIDET